MKLFNKASFLPAFLFIALAGCAQQRVDNDFVPAITNPLFGKGKGPVVLIDGGHHNFHTLEDKFAPFGKVAAMDGFKVQNSTTAITSESLKGVKILVIANALNEQNTNSWQQPVHPAFTAEEIKVITSWVENGGRLFLIADHMPFAGAAASLAQAMGFTFYDGFAMCRPGKNLDIFTFADSTLHHNEITDMHGAVDSIVTFTGQAFKIPAGATSILTFDSSYKVLMPEVAWEFSDDMKIIPAEGLSQLAYMHYGSGKVVVSGEAAMFTAQRAGDARIGLNSPDAKNNVQLLLNILEWLNE